jgi:hypothetical protein
MSDNDTANYYESEFLTVLKATSYNLLPLTNKIVFQNACILNFDDGFFCCDSS